MNRRKDKCTRLFDRQATGCEDNRPVLHVDTILHCIICLPYVQDIASSKTFGGHGIKESERGCCYA